MTNYSRVPRYGLGITQVFQDHYNDCSPRYTTRSVYNILKCLFWTWIIFFACDCLDDHAPTITHCPSSFVAHQRETWGVEVTFSIPTATDNYDQTLQAWTVPADLTSPYNFTADTTCEYHFRDDAGNTASCTFDVSIHGKKCFVANSNAFILQRYGGSRSVIMDFPNGRPKFGIHWEY